MARGMNRRLIAYALALAAAVMLSFAYLSRSNLRSTLAECQAEYHASIFRISNEYLSDYIHSRARSGFIEIAREIAEMPNALSRQPWPQSQVDELLLPLRGGADGHGSLV